MSRTTREFKINDKTLQEAKSGIIDWMNKAGFRINETESKGRVRWSPKFGQVVKVGFCS